MHFTRKLTLLLCSILLSSFTAMAQTDDEDETDTSTVESTEVGRHRGMRRDLAPAPVRRWYTGASFDVAILSTSIMERPGQRRELTTPRFTLLNFGQQFHYDFDEHFGMFSGLLLKNIGFIEKNGDSTTKRRVYTIGAPLGFKLGNLQKRHFGFIGGGVDLPFNYREKRFVKRNDKYKFNEFFSDRTEDLMPYLFAGFSFGSGTVLKMQYYPGNFFNTGFEEHQNGRTVQPYRGYRVNLLYLSLGLDIHYKSHEKTPKVTEDAVEEM